MKWKEILFTNMKIGEKYRIEHHINFYHISSWFREYIGRFYKYNIRKDKAYFNITSSYDYVERIEPHIGSKWFPDTIIVYQMVPQGQTSMERRAYQTILQNLITGILLPAYI
jgi:hypothetical protein